MRIAHIETGNHLYGGARQVLYLLQAMQNDHECILICPAGSAICKAAKSLNVRVIALPMYGDADLLMVFRLWACFRNLKPDVVHIHSRRGADLFGGLASKLADVPCVLSRRVDNPESPVWCRLKYRLYRHVIAISDGIKSVLIKQGLPADKVTTVRSALIAEEFQQPRAYEQFKATFKLQENAVVIAVVAQLIERKGHDLLLQCIPQIIKKNPDLQLIFFGKGKERQALEKKVAALSLQPYVQFTGFREDLPDWLAHIDILVHPAYKEGLGIAILQASAAGVPVVASRAGGMPEAVLDGKTGYLVPPGNRTALSKKLGALIEDKSLRKRLGINGRRYIEDCFSVAAMAEGNLAIYKKVII